MCDLPRPSSTWPSPALLGIPPGDCSAIVLDAFSRKVVGWAMAEHLRASLALDALEMALASREVIAGGLVHHSDRGIQLVVATP